MDIEVASGVIDQILTEADLADPQECCGVLLGEAGRIVSALPARNVHPAPETQFEIDPQLLVDVHRAARGGRPQVLGYYHSHPNGLAEPSGTDQANASGDGRVWAIVTKGHVGFWQDNPGGFAALSYRLVQF